MLTIKLSNWISPSGFLISVFRPYWLKQHLQSVICQKLCLYWLHLGAYFSYWRMCWLHFSVVRPHLICVFFVHAACTAQSVNFHRTADHLLELSCYTNCHIWLCRSVLDNSVLSLLHQNLSLLDNLSSILLCANLLGNIPQSCDTYGCVYVPVSVLALVNSGLTSLFVFHYQLIYKLSTR